MRERERDWEREGKRHIENGTKINYSTDKIIVTDFGMVKRNKMKAIEV